MKIAMITDTHFGEKGGNQFLLNNMETFYKELFFPYIKQNKIDLVVHLGDVFHKNMSMNTHVLRRSKEMFFQPLFETKIPVIMLVGNHDIYYRNSLKLNSVVEYLQEFDFHKCEDFYSETSLDFVPWICDENRDVILKRIKQSKSDFCFGHFELADFPKYKNVGNLKGDDPSFLKRYKMVFSGHYHTRSIKENVEYIGAACEYNWNDYNDPRGFSILDTDIGEIQFIENTFKQHLILPYEDSDIYDIEACANKSVQLVVRKKENVEMFESVKERFLAGSLCEFKVFDVVPVGDVVSEIDTENLQTISDGIKEYVENIEIADVVNRSELMNRFNDLYREAEEVLE